MINTLNSLFLLFQQYSGSHKIIITCYVSKLSLNHYTQAKPPTQEQPLDCTSLLQIHLEQWGKIEMDIKSALVATQTTP